MARPHRRCRRAGDLEFGIGPPSFGGWLKPVGGVRYRAKATRATVKFRDSKAFLLVDMEFCCGDSIMGPTREVTDPCPVGFPDFFAVAHMSSCRDLAQPSKYEVPTWNAK